jgi:hypothetical protein
MLCQTKPDEHVIQQSPRRLAQQHPPPSSTVNAPQNPISFILRPVPQTVKTQVMSFFNSIGCANTSSSSSSSPSPSQMALWFSLTRILHTFSCTDVLCNAQALEAPSAPQLQPPRHLPAPLRPTTCLRCRHQRQSPVPRSPCIFAVRSSRQHSSRETSRRSSCCQNTSISWNGSP